MSTIFSDYNLTPEQEKKGRRILRSFARQEYFGTVTPLLTRIVAENLESVDLIMEAERMIEWVRDKGYLKKKRMPSIARFNNWVRRSKEYKKKDVSVDLERDLEKVKRFKEKYGESSRRSPEANT